MNDSLVCKRYELAQQVYAAHGVDTEQAMAAIDAIPQAPYYVVPDEAPAFIDQMPPFDQQM